MKKLYFILFGLLIFPISVLAETEIRNIYFPTDEDAILTDSFGDGRYKHLHEGVDIMGEKMMPLYAAVDGYISYIVIPEASWGYSITIKDEDDYTYHYIHMNNDTPGTDDGRGGVENAYAPGIEYGADVYRGQLVGWMGDSGNAENVADHLHFEIRRPDKTAIDGYPSLLAALDREPTLKQVETFKGNINDDKEIAAITSPAYCESDSLIKIPDSQAVYYCGADGKRYVFPNDKVYFSWYEDFEGIQELSLEDMAQIPLGGNVTYRPGFNMVKIQSDPKVYSVEKGGVLRWVESPEKAALLYGSEWNKAIDDIPDSFFMNYKLGVPIAAD